MSCLQQRTYLVSKWIKSVMICYYGTSVSQGICLKSRVIVWKILIMHYLFGVKNFLHSLIKFKVGKCTFKKLNPLEFSRILVGDMTESYCRYIWLQNLPRKLYIFYKSSKDDHTHTHTHTHTKIITYLFLSYIHVFVCACMYQKDGYIPIFLVYIYIYIYIHIYIYIYIWINHLENRVG